MSGRADTAIEYQERQDVLAWHDEARLSELATFLSEQEQRLAQRRDAWDLFIARFHYKSFDPEI